MDERGGWTLLMVPVLVCLTFLVIMAALGAFQPSRAVGDEPAGPGCLGRPDTRFLGCHS